MLVTLGTGTSIGAGTSQTFTYSPNSLQKVFIFFDDAETSLQYKDATVTVQLGSKVICNGAQVWGLIGYSNLQCGVGASTDEAFLSLDFGNHEVVSGSNDNLYVTIRGGAAAVTAVDVSAIVDEPGVGTPVKLTEYSDNTFTSDHNLMGISFDSAAAAVDADGYNIEVNNTITSSAPSLISASTWFKATTIANSYDDYYGIVNKNAVPLKTTYNYNASAVTDRILTVEQEPVSRAQINAGRNSAQIAKMQSRR